MLSIKLPRTFFLIPLFLLPAFVGEGDTTIIYYYCTNSHHRSNDVHRNHLVVVAVIINKTLLQ